MNLTSDAVILLTLVITIGVIYNSGKTHKVIELFKKKTWVMGFIFVIIFSAYILSIKGKVDIFGKEVFSKEEDVVKTKTSVKKGIIAFIIALYAEIGLTIAPFWTVFVASYFLDNWI